MPELHFNQSATPVTTVLADGTEIRRTCSAGLGCHMLSCGLQVHVDEDGKLLDIEGDEDHPISKGRLCVRCLTAKDYIYHKDRILKPMRRDRTQRGNPDAWEACTWDEYYDLITDAYRKTVDEYGIDSVTVWSGTGRECGQIHFTLANDVFGTVQAVHPNGGWSCIVPRMAAMLWTMGSSYIEADNAIGFPQRYDDPRWECPKYMLVWGRDPLRSNADGLFGHSLVEMMRRGMKLIVADPRVNWLACRAEVVLQMRPGTDGALALSLLNVAIGEDLYDHEFVENWCYGFEALSERVADYTPEWAGEVCGIDPEDIRRAARLLSEKPCTLSMGLAVDQNPNTLQIGHALLSLFAIYGDMDVPGGCFMGLPPTFAGMAENVVTEMAEKSVDPEGLEKYDRVGVNPAGHEKYPALSYICNSTHPDVNLDVLEGNHPVEFHFAYIFNHNGISCMTTQPQRYLEGIKSIDFVSVTDLFMTPLAQACADVFLPTCSFLEKEGYCSNNNASQPGQIGAIRPVVARVGDTKSDIEIMIDLHKRFYPDSANPDFESPSSYLTSQLSKIRDVDVTYQELSDHVIGQYEIPYRKYELGLLRSDGQPGFNTTTGRIELWSTMLQQLGDDPLPYYLEPKFSAVSRPDMAEEYPLILTTGARQFTSFHSENRQIERLREIHKWPTLQINPATAEKLGITDGSWVWIENLWGKARQKAQITPIVKENVVSADHGWWYPEGDPKKLYGVMESNINRCIPHEQIGPLGFGAPYKSVPCKVYRDTNQQAPTDI